VKVVGVDSFERVVVLDVMTNDWEPQNSRHATKLSISRSNELVSIFL
jgi:hypothetical protein